MTTDEFRKYFHCLTERNPLSWQERLYFEYFAKDHIPEIVDLPTGLGKTMIMAIWLIAWLASFRGKLAGKIPTRLVYVVDRRTVVDQATDLANQLRKNYGKLQELCGEAFDERGLAVSTLRGQLADNREWSRATRRVPPSSSGPSISSARRCSSPVIAPATSAVRWKPVCWGKTRCSSWTRRIFQDRSTGCSVRSSDSISPTIHQ